MTGLTFLLEDDSSVQQMLTLRLGDLGLGTETYSNVSDARRGFEENGDRYNFYLLDMRTPLDSMSKQRSVHCAGLMIRELLLSAGVSENRIYLMTGCLSSYDREAAAEYHVDPSVIIAKAKLRVEYLEKLVMGVAQL